MYDLINGYHVEVSGNGYDLLVRESDDKIIAKNESIDFYNEMEEMTTNNYENNDYKALEAFADFLGF